MNPDHYALVPFGNFMNKLGYIIFIVSFVWALIGLIIGSAFTHDMYTYNNNGYHSCL